VAAYSYSYSIDDPAKNRKRTLAFVLVVLLHVLFFWVLASGLGAKAVQVVLGPVETKIIEALPEDDDEPPPPPPEIDTPPPYVPPPEIAIAAPVDTGPTTAITAVTTEKPKVAGPPKPPPPKPVEKKVVRVPPSTQGRGARATKPQYPPASRRAGEEGTVRLKALVTKDGRAKEVQVVKSSGFPKLDEAAVREVERNWRFVAGKEDGKPVDMWHTFAITFRLQD
jgi:protein TonB